MPQANDLNLDKFYSPTLHSEMQSKAASSFYPSSLQSEEAILLCCYSHFKCLHFEHETFLSFKGSSGQGLHFMGKKIQVVTK